LSRADKPLSEIVAGLPKYISSPEIKVFCPDDQKVELIGKIAPILRQDYPEAEVIDDERAGDGLRLETKDDMFVVRYSQNGPYLTVKFESRTTDGYDKLKVYIRELLRRFPEIDWQAKIASNVEALD